MIDILEELYRTRRPQFFRAAAAIAGDRAGGEDAVQDAFAKAVRKRAAIAAAARSKHGSGGSSSTRPATRAAIGTRCSACMTAQKSRRRTATAPHFHWSC
jgi:DNA-directed RNA polymerase specialized sigma24 family protein